MMVIDPIRPNLCDAPEDSVVSMVGLKPNHAADELAHWHDIDQQCGNEQPRRNRSNADGRRGSVDCVPGFLSLAGRPDARFAKAVVTKSPPIGPVLPSAS